MKKISLLILVLLLGACTASIESIQKSPDKFHDKEISIKGSVLKITSLPLVPLDVMDIYDSTGSLMVVTLKKGSYHANDKVQLKGKLYALNNKNLDSTFSNMEKGLLKELTKSGAMKADQAKSSLSLVFNLLKGFLKDKVNLMILVEY